MARVDGVMGKADNLMLGLNTLAGGKEGGELFLTVKSIRELAEDFDKRSGALMTDGRKTLGDISRAVNNFDRNPTRVLFGASNNGSNAQAAQPAPAPARPAGGARAESGSSEQRSSSSKPKRRPRGLRFPFADSLFATAHPSRPAACASRV